MSQFQAETMDKMEGRGESFKHALFIPSHHQKSPYQKQVHADKVTSKHNSRSIVPGNSQYNLLKKRIPFGIEIFLLLKKNAVIIFKSH